jgi:2-polyprenyl-6-methoxyphenol hydroxylase-like FAD-dependent oxidoreductase
MDARAGLALEKCLPPGLFRLFLATTSRPGTRFTVLSAQLRVLHETPGNPDRDPDNPATLSTSVDRGTLRDILASGLDDRIHYGREIAGYQQDRDGVTLRFVDGSTESADVLVGADGVGSAVRRTLLPEARIVDTGSRVIYGKTPLDDSARRLVPPAMCKGFTAIVGGHVGLAAGLVEFRQSPPEAAAVIAPEVRLSPAADYLMWAVAAQHDRLPAPDAELAGADAAVLHAIACRAIRSWHPDLRALLAKANAQETFLVRVRSSERVPGWPPSRVTLLGDAIHAMSPARGSGANTALMDAANLCTALTGGSDVVEAIGGYEERMRDYGFAAVEASRQAETEISRRGNPLWLWVFNHLPKPRGRKDRVH